MEIGRDALDHAVQRGILTTPQADALWHELGLVTPVPSAAPAGISWREAAGVMLGLLSAVPCVLVLLAAWDRFDGIGVLVSGAALATLLLAAAARLARRGAAVGGGLAAVAVALVPVAVHGLEHAIGHGVLDPPPSDLAGWIAGHGFPAWVAAVAAAAIACWTLPYPILAASVAAAAWGLVLSADTVIFGPDPAWSQRALLSVVVGLVTLGAAFGLDRRARRDWSSWLYLAGLAQLWGGLTTYQAASDATLLLYVAVNAVLGAYALLLERRTLAVVGAVGLAGGLAHWAERRMEGWAMPLVLAAIVVALVAGGAVWVRHERRWSRALIARVPAPLRRLLPPGVGA